MEISILDFCEIYEINWEPINLFLNPETGKKDLLFCTCKDGFKYMPKPDDFTTKLLSKSEFIKRQSYINEFEFIAIDTTKFYHIDVDNKDFINKVADIKNICPYFLSSSKNLPHIIFKSNTVYDLQKTGTIYKFNDNGIEKNAIEILSGIWSYANKNVIVNNFKNNEIPIINIDFLENKNNKSKKNNNISNEIDSYKIDSNIDYDIEVYNIIKKLCDIYKYSRIDIYDDWLNLLFAFKNELGDKGYELFDKLSKKSKNYNEIQNIKLWNSAEIKTFGKRKTLYHLKKWAKEDNLEKYKILIGNDVNDEFIPNCEKDIAEYVIKKFLKYNFVCADVKNSLFYYFNGIRWFEDFNKIKLYNIITKDLVDDFNDKKSFIDNDETIKTIDRTINKLKGKISYFNSIVDHISILTFNKDFISKLDENIDLIGFEDCIFDLIEKKTRKGKPDDYISKSVGYNFPTEYTNYKKDIDTFLEQVFPDKEVREHVIQQQAQALSGRKGKDLIYTHTGVGGNGKSMEIEILKNVFGEYYCNIPIRMLTTQNNSGHNTPDPYLSRLKGIRYASSNEPPDGAKVNDSLIKNIGSQEAQEYRLLFSNVVNTLVLQLKLHIYCNDKLKLKGDDGGLGRRMKVINYVSRFSSKADEKNNVFKEDPSLSYKIKNWINDYMKMLIDKYDINYVYSCPKSIEDASEQYLNENNDILKFVNEYFTFTNNQNDYILLKDIKDLYKNNKEYDQTRLKDLKNSLEKTMKTIVYDRKKINGKDYRSVIIGWSYNEILDEEE